MNTEDSILIYKDLHDEFHAWKPRTGVHFNCIQLWGFEFQIYTQLSAKILFSYFNSWYSQRKVSLNLSVVQKLISNNTSTLIK